MPTYTCWSQPGVVSAEARAQIAAALTEIHHEVALAPRYLVQVIFAEVTPGSVYIAGQPKATGHLWVRADIRAGRTATQKHELLGRITTQLAGILRLRPEDVWAYICDIPGHNMSEHGRDLPDPGNEAQWFAQLPEAMRDTLTPLA